MPANAAMRGDRSTFRKITISGSERPIIALMKGSTVATAAPLLSSASAGVVAVVAI